MAVVAQQRTGDGIASACAALSVARASFYRRHHPTGAGPRRPRFVPRALLPAERTQVLARLTDDRFADRTPVPPCVRIDVVRVFHKSGGER